MIPEAMPPSTPPLNHFAHSLPGRPFEEWQSLEDHLNQTADMAESFAATFAPGWGRIAGLWHDAGKYQRAFQIRIGAEPDLHTNAKVDHSSVGALIAMERKAHLVAFVVAGHHGGIPNASDVQSRLEERKHLLPEARRDGLPKSLEQLALPLPPTFFTDQAQLSLWTRFLFSALVDADFLDTEKFYAGGIERNVGPQPSLADLKIRLDTYMASKTVEAKKTPVNKMRARVLDACREKASMNPGAFTLTVPTGGGKTLASLTFALDHALKHGLRRVIVVIPYTTIIEQTANTYREALGAEAVLEHHSNVDPDNETPTSRLVSENWDAPVVVTTNVQFFESLYGNRTSRCRKLHRVPHSVVVFDEVQTFPIQLLEPVKHVLRELSANYGTTTVFCTATQPTLFEGVREILPNSDAEFATVAGRCEVLMPKNEEPIEWEALAEELKGHPRVLSIVHRRDDAQKLAELTGEDCFHLSARMCPLHRTEVLEDVKRRLLKSGEKCRLVATQLIEAGVDIDFPEVYRAFAGADSLAQAAGRCNREGGKLGRLHVFIPPTKPPKGILRTAQEVARTMWRENKLDLTLPSTFVDYFRRLYSLADCDAPGVMAAERKQKFKDVADLFRIIANTGQPVVAPYGDWKQRVDEIREEGISGLRMRRLQPFMVNLYPQEIVALAKAGAIELVQETFWAVIVPGLIQSEHIYSSRWGFGWKGPLAAEPEDLVA